MVRHGLTSFSLATLITEFQLSSVFHPSLYDAPKYLDLLKVLLFPVGKTTIWNSGGTFFSNPSNSQNIYVILSSLIIWFGWITDSRHLKMNKVDITDLPSGKLT